MKHININIRINKNTHVHVLTNDFNFTAILIFSRKKN
jgi:hypothetical protein